MDKSVSIFFGTPKHGWLPVDFLYDDFKIDFEASDALNYPLEELCDFIINSNTIKTGQVIWWLEPFTYFFDFEKTESDYVLKISQADDVEEKRELIKTIQGSFDEILFPFVKSLTAFCGQTYEENHWPNIDKNKFNKLKLIVADTSA